MMMGIYQSYDDGSWSSARAEDMVFSTLKQWRKPDIQAHYHGLDLSAGSSMGAITRDGGLGWLCGVLRWRTWPLFSFLSLLLFLYYFVCVSDRDGLPNGFDYYLFFPPRAADVLVSLTPGERPNVNLAPCFISFLRHFLARQWARAVMNELWQGQPTPGDFGTGYRLAIGEGMEGSTVR